MNENDSLSLSKDSSINYLKNKSSVKVKEHTIEDNDKYDFLFYSLMSELSRIPNQIIHKYFIKSLLKEAKKV